MKAEIIQCADRPQIERHGERMVITFTDTDNGQSKAEINLSQAWCLAQDIMEMIRDYQEAHVDPVFKNILDQIENGRPKA